MYEYDLIADWYASERVDQTGVAEAKSLASSIPPGSRILDAGCGNGIPITRALLESGHHVIALDSSSQPTQSGTTREHAEEGGLLFRCGRDPEPGWSGHLCVYGAPYREDPAAECGSRRRRTTPDRSR